MQTGLYTHYRDGKYVVEAQTYEGVTPICTVHEHGAKGATLARACILSASPDMLQALEELVAEFDAEPYDHRGPWYGRNDTTGIMFARDAIAKATGE